MAGSTVVHKAMKDGCEKCHDAHGSKHVMATPMGENAFLVRLERFLIDHQGEVPALLDAAEAVR